MSVWPRSDFPPPPETLLHRLIRRLRYRVSAWAEKAERMMGGM